MEAFVPLTEEKQRRQQASQELMGGCVSVGAKHGCMHATVTVNLATGTWSGEGAQEPAGTEARALQDEHVEQGNEVAGDGGRARRGRAHFTRGCLGP